MRKIKDANYFPDYYRELVDNVTLGKIARVPLESETLARKLRGQFYAFVGCLKNVAAELGDLQIKQAKEEERLGKGKSFVEITPAMKLDAARSSNSARVLVTIRPMEEAERVQRGWPQGVILSFMKRDDSWQMQALRTATYEESTSPAEEKLNREAAEAVRRMAKFATVAPSAMPDEGSKQS